MGVWQRRMRRRISTEPGPSQRVPKPSERSWTGSILTPRRARWRGARVESGARMQPSLPPSRRRGTRRPLHWLGKQEKVTAEFRRRNQNISSLAKGAWARQTGDEAFFFLNLHISHMYFIPSRSYKLL